MPNKVFMCEACTRQGKALCHVIYACVVNDFPLDPSKAKFCTSCEEDQPCQCRQGKLPEVITGLCPAHRRYHETDASLFIV